jgi:hypothetical protein
MVRTPITRAEAVERLTNRWEAEAFRWPMMSQYIPLKLYVSANLRKVMECGLLAEYKEKTCQY